MYLHVVLVVSQQLDAFAKGHDGRVDIASFFQSRASVLSFRVTLRAGKINEG